MMSIEEIQRDLLLRIQTEGVLAAYEAALAVARDAKAPHAARTAAATTLFRAAGFGRPDSAVSDVHPHEMTPDQLAAELRRLGRTQRELERPEHDLFS